MSARSVEIKRKTKETDVSLTFDPDLGDRIEVKTGLPFFDHLLTSLAFHGRFTFVLTAKGDLEVDGHHLVEDVGIVLGQALAGVLEKGAVARFAHAVIPMDEALAEAAIDVCGRPTLVFNADFPQQWVGTFDTALIREFLIGLTSKAGMSLHADIKRGENSHHMAEALFKALGKAISRAYRAAQDQMSSKGRIG